MILTKEQARAVYDAMCALNNVGGTVRAQFIDCEAAEAGDGCVYVSHIDGAIERHESQAMFHLAYDL